MILSHCSTFLMQCVRDVEILTRLLKIIINSSLFCILLFPSWGLFCYSTLNKYSAFCLFSELLTISPATCSSTTWSVEISLGPCYLPCHTCWIFTNSLYVSCSLVTHPRWCGLYIVIMQPHVQCYDSITITIDTTSHEGGSMSYTVIWAPLKAPASKCCHI